MGLSYSDMTLLTLALLLPHQGCVVDRSLREQLFHWHAVGLCRESTYVLDRADSGDVKVQ
jgi:hypothetical protein